MMAEDDKVKQVETVVEAEVRYSEADNLDIKNRNPLHLNTHIAYDFHEIIGEPDKAHSAEVVWKTAFKCFTGSANCCYTFLTYLCAIPAACCWGCNFACLAFEHIWCLTPSIKYCKMSYYPIMRLYVLAILCVCVPFFEAVALVFSKVGVYKSDTPPVYKSRHDEFGDIMARV